MKNRALHVPVFVVLVAALCCLFSCTEINKPDSITRAGYFWKGTYTNYENGIEPVINFVDTHSIKKIYIKMLDVDWSPVHHAFPVSKTQLYIYPEDSLEYIPVVYITNPVFLNIDSAEIPKLALRIMRQLLRVETNARRRCKEIQVDCDWTAQSRDKYFYFLTELKKLRTYYTLSVTLRLYQYKYPEKTGVPPADRAMLMLYNIENSRTYNLRNNIFDKQEAEKYVQSDEKYTIPLDYALPAFSWAVLFRNKESLGLLNNFTAENVAANTAFTKKEDNLFVINRDTVIGGVYLRPGDELKTETCDAATLNEAREVAFKTLNNPNPTISIFHMSNETISYYSYEDIESVFDIR